jgi:hypothetical protein
MFFIGNFGILRPESSQWSCGRQHPQPGKAMESQTRSWSRIVTRSAQAALLVTLLVTMSSCSNIAVFLGLRIRLDSLPVTAVSASLVTGRAASPVNALAPGQSAQLVIVATTQDGKQYLTVGAGKGKVAFDNYTITATIVQATKKGKVSLSADPRVSEGKVAHVHIVPTAHPDVVADLDIPIRYDVPFVANFSGADGTDGIDGFNGVDGNSGMDGTPGAIDPTTGASGPQGPGGRGSDGGMGGNGSNGQDGAPGAAVHIWIRLESQNVSQRLLQIKVQGGNRQLFYLIDTNGGSLKVLDNGGAGGRAGKGGQGGRGGAGGSGNPPGMNGLDGQPGLGGWAGQDGAAGTISVSVDPTAQSLMNCITWTNRGGGGRAGVPATITVEPVGSLW